jgi:hypothetical protein
LHQSGHTEPRLFSQARIIDMPEWTAEQIAQAAFDHAQADVQPGFEVIADSALKRCHGRYEKAWWSNM